ncbi:hypothetical protein ILYODFUR_012614 [Ilyodon furcidens]|uniref:Calponin-homology (CH) domain-containing protein n=1 Tax=Ilyodon furcidens TaxID=33524 RepID=A0ABV0VF15_9TELE
MLDVFRPSASSHPPLPPPRLHPCSNHSWFGFAASCEFSRFLRARGGNWTCQDQVLLKSVGLDEREAVQKKTFTKWVNSHLSRVSCRITDLYMDLRDGRMLIKLLEVLSGERLHIHGNVQLLQRCADVSFPYSVDRIY